MNEIDSYDKETEYSMIRRKTRFVLKDRGWLAAKDARKRSTRRKIDHDAPTTKSTLFSTDTFAVLRYAEPSDGSHFEVWAGRAEIWKDWASRSLPCRLSTVRWPRGWPLTIEKEARHGMSVR